MLTFQSLSRAARLLTVVILAGFAALAAGFPSRADETPDSLFGVRLRMPMVANDEGEPASGYITGVDILPAPSARLFVVHFHAEGRGGVRVSFRIYQLPDRDVIHEFWEESFPEDGSWTFEGSCDFLPEGRYTFGVAFAVVGAHEPPLWITWPGDVLDCPPVSASP